MLRETVAAIHWATVCRFERNFRLLPAIAAYGRVHFPRPSVKSSASSSVFSISHVFHRCECFFVSGSPIRLQPRHNSNFA